jgi:hypothetical protein
MSKATVVLGIIEINDLCSFLTVNSKNPSVTLEKADFELVKGCLPLRHIMNLWKIKDVKWLDVSLIYSFVLNFPGRSGARLHSRGTK